MKRSEKKIPMRKPEMKRRAIFIGLCFLSLAINVLLLCVCQTMISNAEFDPKILFGVLAIVVYGIFRAEQSVRRSDPSVIGVFIGTAVISLICVGTCIKISLYAGALTFAFMSVQIAALLITYFKWVTN